MVEKASLTPEEREIVERIVTRYITTEQAWADRLAKIIFELVSAEQLRPHVHSIKMRAKDPEHLRDKLERKVLKARKNGVAFDITEENFPQKINDLAGVRILHLNTAQFPEINRELLRLLEQGEYELIEKPVARTWDDEYKKIFTDYGIDTESNPRMYTSVHYVVGIGRRSVEIQVRTLAEELWGEVDHTINYPHPTSIPSCQEQIKVLARITSSCTRLVDSIFVSNAGSLEAVAAPVVIPQTAQASPDNIKPAT
jgi:putative GTP pyrophosphokinase